MSLLTNTTKLTELKTKAKNLPNQNPPINLQEKTIKSVIGDGHEEVILPDTDFDGFSSIRLKSAIPNLQDKSVNNNLKYQVVEYDEGYDGLGSVEILEPNLEITSITPSMETQTIKPSDGYAAISEVRVYGDENLVPENIKEGVSIFGVEGKLSTGIPINNITLYQSGSEAEINYRYPNEVSGVVNDKLIFKFIPNISGIINFDFYREGTRGESIMKIVDVSSGTSQSTIISNGDDTWSSSEQFNVIKGKEYAVYITNSNAKSVLSRIGIFTYANIKLENLFSITN